ncbi:MAG TPA: PKD domain-containing protein, partial [Candidatus Thermoplasmatota archaeon]|nr:PKD domain-containing protein [Candidatus Thermoplasmatota archaeon]
PLDPAASRVELRAGATTVQASVLGVRDDPTMLIALVPAAAAPSPAALAWARAVTDTGITAEGHYFAPKAAIPVPAVTDLLDGAATPLRLDPGHVATSLGYEQLLRFVPIADGSYAVEALTTSPYQETTTVTLLLGGAVAATANHTFGTADHVPGLRVDAGQLSQALVRTKSTPFTLGRTVSGAALQAAFVACRADDGGCHLAGLLTGEAVVFESVSFVPPGEAATSSWDFGDGSPRKEAPLNETVTHRFTRAGAFTVTLTVKAEGGRTATATRTLEVLNRAPLVRSFLLSTSTPSILDTVSGSVFAVDPEGGRLAFQWHLDGTPLPKETRSGVVLTEAHLRYVTGKGSLVKGATHVLAVTITDPLGGLAEHEAAFTVRDLDIEVSAPRVTFPASASYGIPGEVLTVTATVSDRDDAITAATLRLTPIGGGTPITQPLALASGATWQGLLVAPAPGRYEATVEGQNAAGKTRTGAASRIDVRANELPRFTLTGPTVVEAGEIVDLGMAQAFDPDYRGALAYRWFLGGSLVPGAQTNRMNVTAGPGLTTTTVFAEATDVNGGTTSKSLTYRVDDAISLALTSEAQGFLGAVTALARVTDDTGAPVAGARVTFTLLGPGGIALGTTEAFTNANGDARYVHEGPHVPGEHVVKAEARSGSRPGAPRMDIETASAVAPCSVSLAGDGTLLP